MRNQKWTKPTALARLLTVFMAYVLVFGDASPLREEGSGEKLSSNSKSSVASEVLQNMDEKVNPCDNFYQYACGGFLKSMFIPNDGTTVNTFSILENKMKDQLLRSFRTKSDRDHLKPYRLVKNLYASCMNTTAIEAKGLQPLQAILKKLGGWPVLEGSSWNEEAFNWINSTYKFRNVGYPFDSLIRFYVGIDMKNRTRRLIQLSQAVLPLSRKYLMEGFEDERVSAYYNYMVDIAVILGAQKDRAEEELKDSLRFAMELADISLPPQEMRNATKLYNLMTLGELTENYPSIPWKEFFSKLLSSSITVEEDEVANVRVPSYISAFEKLILRTPKRVQANYIMWNAVEASIPYLNNEIRDRQLAYSTTVNGQTEHPSRWKECVSRVSDDVDVSIHAIYAREYFNSAARNNALDMVKDIKKEFEQTLKEADWMDNKTRDKALEKVASMVSYIGYPDELLDDNIIEKILENYELSEDNYFDNFLNASLFSMEFSFRRLREPYNANDWLEHGATAVVNGFYSTASNSIQFPAGILQGIFFSDKRPKYMNYGAIGSVIGHEMTHAFDDIGSQFDKNGKLVDWWEPATKENYLKRKACMIEQYGNYTVEEVQLKLNGVTTQGENIADNGGIKVAYRAYNNWATKNGPEKMLPGLEKTPQQMFWISYANVWCSKDRPETLKNRIITGSHVPKEFRVLGTLSNMPEFAKDFNCPVGSRMNPARKCSVW